jgi:hypothetical protein
MLSSNIGLAAVAVQHKIKEPWHSKSPIIMLHRLHFFILIDRCNEIKYSRREPIALCDRKHSSSRFQTKVRQKPITHLCLQVRAEVTFTGIFDLDSCHTYNYT